MLLQLHTGQVQGYSEGQLPLIYLTTTVQDVAASGAKFVFSDGHGLAKVTSWFSDLADLHRVDWDLVGERYWADTVEDNDRQRRKQAEFLVHRFCPWSLIREIGVYSRDLQQWVEDVLKRHGIRPAPVVAVRRSWYYLPGRS